MGLPIGLSEHINCIEPVTIVGENGEALCLAYKSEIFFLGAGVYLKDGGYVLRRTQEKDIYYNLSADDISEYQANSLLPTPLPSYSLGVADYFVGYSLWILLVVLVAYSVIATKRTKGQAATDGPMALDTELDRFIHARASEHLTSGEQIESQAYVIDRMPSVLAWVFTKAHYAVVTNKRLLFFPTERRVFKAAQVAGKVESVDRAWITAVDARTNGVSILTLQDGSTKTLYVHAPIMGGLSNQSHFLYGSPNWLRQAEAQSQAIAV